MAERGTGGSRAALKKRKRQEQARGRAGEGAEAGGAGEATASAKPRKLDIFQRPPCTHALLGDLAGVTVEDILQLKDPEEATSYDKAALIMAKLVHPTSYQDFTTHHWERGPLLAEHHAAASHKKPPSNANYMFGKFLTRKSVRAMVSTHLFKPAEEVVVEGAELPEDEISGSDLWSKYSDTHVIALLQPHIHEDLLWRLCAALEFEVGSRVDCQLLLLPRHSAAEEAALLLDTDRMLVQLEGSAAWQVENGELQLPFSLAPGDCLYVPTGASLLRQAGHDNQALVLQLIFNKRNARLADVLSLALPQAVALEASARLGKLGRALPRHALQRLGAHASEDDEDELRAAILKEVEKCLTKVAAQTMEMLDPAADQMAKSVIAERLPVPLAEHEEARTAAGNASARILPYTRLRMLRPGVAAAVVEDGKVVVYHCMDNSRTLFGAPLSPLEFELDDGLCIEGLLRAYPEAVVVADLEHPAEDIEDKVGVAEALYREGFLVIADDFSFAQDAVAEGEDEDEDDDPF